MQTNEIYVFSVKRGRKKRLIEMAQNKTLYDLHQEIQVEFELDDDHMYGFAVGNKFWSGRIIAEGNPLGPSKDVGIEKIILHEQLIYMYDYGDEVQFKVELIEIK